MRGTPSKPSRKLLIFLPLLFLVGCASTKQPIYLSNTFGEERIENIYVLPAVDLRFDQDPELPRLDKWVQRIALSNIKRKRYTYTITDPSRVDNITEEYLREIDAEWVKGLGPDESRWIFVVAVLDARSKLIFGSTGNAEVSGYLFDKKDGSTVWRDKGNGEVLQLGPMGMLVKGFALGDAFNMAMMDLMASFPKNTKKKR